MELPQQAVQTQLHLQGLSWLSDYTTAGAAHHVATAKGEVELQTLPCRPLEPICPLLLLQNTVHYYPFVFLDSLQATV